MRDKSKKEGIEHRPPTTLSADGVDAWYMMQRHREQELRQRRKEAADILRGYRMVYTSDDQSDYGSVFSPRYNRNRTSFGTSMSESLVDPDSLGGNKRRHTMARLENNWVPNDTSSQYDNSSQPDRNRFAPNRADFLRAGNEYHGDNFSIGDRSNYENTRRLFSDNDSLFSPERRGPRSSQRGGSRYIDTSESRQRLGVSEEKKIDDPRHMNQDGRKAAMDDVISVPETVWRDFISSGESRIFKNV